MVYVCVPVCAEVRGQHWVFSSTRSPTFICMCCLPALLVCAPPVYSAHRIQKRALDPMELELLTVVRCHVSAEHQTLDL